MSKFSLIIEPFNGLLCLDIPSYTLKKYSIYQVIFSEWTKWIRPKAEWIGYLDLTTGPGYSKVKECREIGDKQVAASPIIALRTEPRFTDLMFIERNRKYCNALKERIKEFCEGRNCDVLNEDANKYIRYAIKRLEGHCLVCIDPFRPRDLGWETLENVLQEDLCDVVSVYPAPLTQRPIRRHRGRLFIPGVHKHMPPGFQLDMKEEVLRTSSEFCRKKIGEIFGRSVLHCFIRGVPYPILFATKDFELGKHIYNKLKSEGVCDEIAFKE